MVITRSPYGEPSCSFPPLSFASYTSQVNKTLLNSTATAGRNHARHRVRDAGRAPRVPGRRLAALGGVRRPGAARGRARGRHGRGRGGVLRPRARAAARPALLLPPRRDGGGLDGGGAGPRLRAARGHGGVLGRRR